MNKTTLRVRREALGLSQEDFGTILGTILGRKLKQVTIARWENGAREPRDWLNIELALSAIEDVFKDLIGHFIAVAESEGDLANSPDVEFTIYFTAANFERAEPHLASQGVTHGMHRLAAGQAALELSEDGYNVTFVEG